MVGLAEAIRTGARSLRRNPGRSGLTVLGLAIGVATFIATVSFGLGARASVVQQFEWLGVNVLSIRKDGRGAQPLTDRDVRLLRDATTTLELIVPEQRWRVPASHDGQSVLTGLEGSTADAFRLTERRFRAGGPYDAVDVARRASVCVIGATVDDALFPGREALDASIQLDGRLRCRVVGVLVAQGRATSGRDLDNVVLMPVSTAQAHLGAPNGYSEIKVRPRPGLRADAREEIEATMRRAHGLADDVRADFWIKSPDDARRVADSVAQIITGLLGAIAGVSLLVGGIGIMNIQLVAVAERTKEIGIKAAIGATPRQILLQFLAEAMFLALVGTGLGTLAGVSVALAVAQVMNWPTAVPAVSVGVAVAFGAGTGLLFGLLPARRAAALDPIEALRRE
jgi:putative ABC transport system permease protein